MIMAKTTCLSRLLQIRISVFVAYILCLISIIQFFVSYGTYNYTSIPRDVLESELYKAVSPKLVLKPGKPDCKYGPILQSTKTIKSWEVPKKYDDFSVKGLANGSYVPEDCNPLFSVAIVVPYRKRQSQLDIFLPYMHNLLRKQSIHYKIFVIEQQDDKPWNKGVLFNIGVQQVLVEKFPCLILHDVDLLPLDEANLYVCLRRPRHLSASIDKFRFVLPYDWLVGGALAIRAEDYVAVDGFSNRFEGWGGEDDDFYERLAEHGLSIARFPREMSRYTMLRHAPEPSNALRTRLLADARQRRGAGAGARDGLGSARVAGYSVRPHRLFTLIGVNL